MEGTEGREAEAAVISGVMLDAKRLAEIPDLTPAHFGYEGNRIVFSTILELRDAGDPFDTVTMLSALRSRGKLEEIGGTARLIELSDATPSVANIAVHARLVMEAAAKRAASSFGKVVAIEGANGIQDPSAWLDQKAHELDQIRQRISTKERFPGIGVPAIFAPLEPIRWIVRALGFCPGAPAMIAGYGYSGKTVAGQALAVALAGGLPNIWGSFSCVQGRVLHLDYEQGARLTRERYQRLAMGHGVSPAELDGRLTLSSMPRRFLSHRSAEADIEKAVTGYDLCLLDSFRASCPGIDENSSEAREPLDRLLRVSERTGCAFLVLHHSGKPKPDGGGGAKHAPRGSSGIFDACSSVLVFEAEKGEPVRCSHTKERGAGHTVRDFLLTIEDTSDGGLSVTAEDAPDVEKRETAGELDERVFLAVKEYPGSSGKQIRAIVPGRAQRVVDALSRLELGKRIRPESGPRGAELWHVI